MGVDLLEWQQRKRPGTCANRPGAWPTRRIRSGRRARCYLARMPGIRLMGKPVPFPGRFWSKVDKEAPVPQFRPELGNCWWWTAYRDHKGYGHLKGSYGRGSKVVSAHRSAYELLVGPIPEGKQLDHLCRVTRCVRPSHLEPVTNRENVLRGFSVVAVQAATTHCPEGHPYAGDNLVIKPSEQRRRCRECKNAQERARYHAKRAGT